MKIKSILMTGLIGLALGSMASATAPTVTLHFTGSTAFRSATHAAIIHCFDSAPSVATDGTNVGFRGTINSTDTFISCYWSGSEAGIKSLARKISANKINFVSYTAVDTLGSTVTGTTMPGNVTLTSYLTDSTWPDVAMSDTYQSSSAYKTKAGQYTQLTGADGTTDGIVGVVAFKWLASHGSTITGITAKQANSLYSTGYLPLSFFTGSASDATSWVYAIGRDSGSGTRLTTATEIGLSAVGGLVQYNPLTTGSTQVSATGATIASLAAVGATGGLADNYSGYSSGGTLCKVLWNSAPTGTSIIGYSGQLDADTAGQGIDGGNGAVELAYNGVTLGNIATNWPLIAQGKYTFWGYEHAYINSSLTDATSLTIVSKIANQIKSGATTGTPDAPHPYYLTEMLVERAGDGQPVTLKAGNAGSKPY